MAIPVIFLMDYHSSAQYPCSLVGLSIYTLQNNFNIITSINSLFLLFVSRTNFYLLFIIYYSGPRICTRVSHKLVLVAQSKAKKKRVAVKNNALFFWSTSYSFSLRGVDVRLICAQIIPFFLIKEQIIIISTWPTTPGPGLIVVNPEQSTGFMLLLYSG